MSYNCDTTSATEASFETRRCRRAGWERDHIPHQMQSISEDGVLSSANPIAPTGIPERRPTRVGVVYQ